MPDGKLWTQRDRFGNDVYLNTSTGSTSLTQTITQSWSLISTTCAKPSGGAADVKTRMTRKATSITLLSQTYRMITPTSLSASTSGGPLSQTAVYTWKSL